MTLRLFVPAGIVHGKLNLPTTGNNFAPLNLAAADFDIGDAVAHLPQQHAIHGGLLDRGRSGNGGPLRNGRTTTGAHGNFTVPCRENINRAIALQRQRRSGNRRVHYGVTFGCRHCSGNILTSGRNGHRLHIAGAGKIAIERFHGAVTCNTAACLPGGDRADNLAGKAAIFAKTVVVHGPAQGCTDAAGLPADGACGALLYMTTHHAGEPACKGVAGCGFCGSS